jgi:YfiH family protein
MRLMDNQRMARRHPTRRPTQRGKRQSKAIQQAWTFRERAGIKILTATTLDSLPWLVHGFSTRTGGASRLDGRTALNLGFTDWDSRETVARNRTAFLNALNSPNIARKSHRIPGSPPPLVTLHQIHSDVVHLFSGSPDASPRADAAISRQPGFLLGIQTADCVPILLADVHNQVVAAIHAGWRGTLARIAAKTLGRMRLEFGTNPANVFAALGPAIGPCCYEVGPEVALAFSGQFAQAAEWFSGPFDRLSTGEEPNPLPWLTMMPPGHQPPPERVQLDLRAANRWQLIDAGVNAENIAVSSLCTRCRPDLFFSYRREGARAGRMLSVIGIRKPPR